MVSNPKTIFFSRKPKNQKIKNKKKNLFQNYGAGASKRCFFWFFGFLEKKMVFWFETIFFSEKKMVFGGLLLVKQIFLEKKMVFRRMVAQNHLFLEKKMVSNQKTIFFSRKPKKPRKPKKNIFSKTMGLGPPKDGFFGFLEKKMVFLVRNHLFPQPHSFGKDGFFGFFGFLVFVSFLFCCFSLDLARTRLPPAVGPLGGGGEHIYIYIYIYKIFSCIFMGHEKTPYFPYSLLRTCTRRFLAEVGLQVPEMLLAQNPTF